MKTLNNTLRILSITLIIGLTQACFPFTQFESARTVGKNNIQMGASVSSFSIKEDIDVSNTGFISLPYFDVNMDYGVSDVFDIGLNINSFGFTYFDAKLQIAGDKLSRNSFSVGLGVDINPFLIGSLDVDGNNYYKLHLPLYYSHHFNNNKAFLFMNPKIAYQITSGLDDNESYLFMGASTGIGFKRKSAEWLFGLGLFGGKNVENSGDFALSLLQPGMGFKYTFED